MKMKKHTIVATCASGIEQLLASEIVPAGGSDIVETRGAVSFQGDLTCAYYLCLWSRFASKILIELDRFPVQDGQSLYDHVVRFAWEEHCDVTTTFAVDAVLTTSATLQHSHFAALKIKDALVDRFREKTGSRPSVSTSRPGIRINFFLDGSEAILSLDLSGESLHRRGYRVAGTKAPLKETLAAALVALSGWGDTGEFAEAFVDPMCGTGTLLIEAALMAGDVAPGLSRSYFGFMGWKQHDPQLWENLVSEAIAREERASHRDWPFIMGYDSDPVAVSAARKNIARAGLEDRIQVRQAELATLQPPRVRGILLTNLPYGERLSDPESAGYLYRALGRIAQERFPQWRLGVFIAKPELTDSFQLSWNARHKLMNGPIPCRLLITDIAASPAAAGFVWTLQEKTPEDGDFAHRLRKNLKKQLPWAIREEISCFRIYDRDLPEYNVSVDIYGKWLLVQEYAAPKEIAEEIARTRFQTVLKSLQMVLGIRSDRIFVRIRQRQKGKNQYQKTAARKKLFEVQEGRCRLLINLTDYLDTGLFLDHRPLRMMIHNESAGKRFLNLFAYTGTASVHAAAGGASSTTTVDLSENYLQWARMNLALNGFDVVTNHLVKADCLQWLAEDSGTYDLILVDPPTFSNTKKEKRVFDVQRDHERLILLAMKHLSRTGILYFSSNFRDFRLSQRITEQFQAKDITKSTIPPDFSRNARIHCCWQLAHKSGQGSDLS